MPDSLTREQFSTAVADAVNGVLNVYREVDAMLRELGAALGADEPRFKTLVKRLVPGAGAKNPDARYLRDYHAWFFAPVDASEDEDDEGDEDDGDDGEEDDDSATEKPKKALTVEVGSGILLARASIYDRSTSTFEPNLCVAALARCRVNTDAASGTLIKISRSRFKKIVRAVDGFRWAAGKAMNTLNTRAPVQLVGQPKGKHILLCDLPNAPERHPLYDVTPAKVQQIVNKVRSTWNLASGVP